MKKLLCQIGIFFSLIWMVMLVGGLVEGTLGLLHASVGLLACVGLQHILVTLSRKRIRRVRPAVKVVHGQTDRKPPLRVA